MGGGRAGLGLVAAGLVLSGCAQAGKTKADYLHLRTEQQERANYAACVDGGAMPGSVENLACRLEMTRKEKAAAKPQAAK